MGPSRPPGLWRLAASLVLAGVGLAFLWSLRTPASPSWAKAYGGAGRDMGFSIQPTPDGGYLVAGMTGSFGVDTGEPWVLRLDGRGKVVWGRTYGVEGPGIATAIRPAPDGGYVVLGDAGGPLQSQIWVLKLDSQGRAEWRRSYGGEDVDAAADLRPAPDGGYVLTGWTASFGAGHHYDLWVLKLDPRGRVQWGGTYGGAGRDMGFSIQPTPDGGYLVAGMTASFGDVDLWLLKLDGQGKLQWDRTYGGPGEDLASDLQPTPDGGYVVAGRTNSFGAGGGDLWLLKLDPLGRVQWGRVYGGPGEELAVGVHPTPEGGYVVAGSTPSFSRDYDVWLLGLDGRGEVRWGKAYGGRGEDLALAFRATPDGGYVVAGATDSFGAGYEDLWVLRLDREGSLRGCLGPGWVRGVALRVGVQEAKGQVSVGGALRREVLLAPQRSASLSSREARPLVQTQCGD